MTGPIGYGPGGSGDGSQDHGIAPSPAPVPLPPTEVPAVPAPDFDPQLAVEPRDRALLQTGASPAELTVRAVSSGMVFGGVLSLCNIYTGLKIGWSTNMSITAALLGYGTWAVAGKAIPGAKGFSILESNINQTAASAGASVSSAGLVAPIPALAILTGATLGWASLSIWIFSVTLVGIVVAIGLRRQMLERDKMPFPFGVASAETLKEMYARGQEALVRVYMLLGAAAVAAALKFVKELASLKAMPFPGSVGLSGAAATKGVTAASMKNLGFAANPGLLFVGVGALIGFRACASLLAGAILAWLIIAPEVLTLGWSATGAPDKAWFGVLIKWMLWPGVALMVSSSLTSFAMSGPQMVRGFLDARRAAVSQRSGADEVPRRWFYPALGFVMVASVVLQVVFFGIPWWLGSIGVVFTFALAVVAARVSGETGITPVGPMGKVTQLMFGVISPGNATANLMAANVTGGAASQAGDMLHDLKTGQLLGASPRLQAVAQVFGVLAGSLVGTAAYLLLVPDPSTMLLTDEWPAPAVAQWMAVAELFQDGFDKMPSGALGAVGWASVVGVVLAVLERSLPKRAAAYVPSATSMGLAFVIPAYYSISIFAGGVIALISGRVAKTWTARFLIVIAAGLILGESLTGVGFAIETVVSGLSK